jgi:hypothetical protein
VDEKEADVDAIFLMSRDDSARNVLETLMVRRMSLGFLQMSIGLFDLCCLLGVVVGFIVNRGRFAFSFAFSVIVCKFSSK